MTEKPISLQTKIPLIGGGGNRDDQLLQALAPTFQQIMLALNEMDGRIAKLEGATKNINVFINPIEIKKFYEEVKSVSSNPHAIEA